MDFNYLKMKHQGVGDQGSPNELLVPSIVRITLVENGAFAPGCKAHIYRCKASGAKGPSPF
jgi:hypothetical protein